MQKEISIDTHLHANVKGRSEKFRERKAALLASSMAHLDIVCSTEHAYKDPLGAYEYLCEVVEKNPISTEIMPGVEAISREGVDIIFLANSKASLEDFLKEFKPFSWSIKDIEHVGNGPEFIKILPHAFSPSKTGIVTALGLEKAKALFSSFDYIEISNGSFFDADFLPARIVDRLEKVKHTRVFPEKHHPSEVGASIGSDAHTPNALNIFGTFLGDPNLSAFENLSQRKSMKLNILPSKKTGKAARIASGLTISLGEYFEKQAYKIRN